MQAVVVLLVAVLAACGSEDSGVIEDFATDTSVPDDSSGGADDSSAGEEDAGAEEDPVEETAEVPAPEAANAPAADPPAELVDAACAEGSLLLYESTPGEAMGRVLAAFQDAYPCIETAEHVRLPAAEIPVRITQESQAGQPTADAIVTGPDLIDRLHEQDLVDEVDWVAAGIPEELATPYSVVTTSSLYVLMYNTDLVAAEDAPIGWEDLLDPEWEGAVAAWSRPAIPALLAPVWGAERIQALTQGLVDNGVVLLEDNPAIPAGVGAGEYAVGMINRHAGIPVVESGAPVEFVLADPLPVTLLYAGIPSEGENSNAGQLFVNWVNGPEGSVVLEQETNRGNALLPGTESYELTQGVEVGTYPSGHIHLYDYWLEELGPGWQSGP